MGQIYVQRRSGRSGTIFLLVRSIPALRDLVSLALDTHAHLDRSARLDRLPEPFQDSQATMVPSHARVSGHRVQFRHIHRNAAGLHDQKHTGWRQPHRRHVCELNGRGDNKLVVVVCQLFPNRNCGQQHTQLENGYVYNLVS